MITLTLLHPSQSTPVQSWLFDSETLVRLGRGAQNDVILYSAVVSRRHAELQQQDSRWELINFGANGTYVDGKSVSQVPVNDGMVIRLGESGPKLLIRLGLSERTTLGKLVNRRPTPVPTERDPYKGRNTLFNLGSLHPPVTEEETESSTNLE